MQYAVSRQTAAEIIYNRANADKEYMDLTSWKNSPNGKILETDVVIAKNYLSKDELESLELTVSAFLDLAENRAKRHIPMTMKDWAIRIDKFLLADDLDVLKDAGKISHEIACDKALTEFEKYRIKQDKLYKSDFDLLLEEGNKIGEKMNNLEEKNSLLIYKNEDGNIVVDAIFKDDTLWLTQKAMSKVFDCSTDNISLHLKNIFKDKELNEISVVEESSITASDGKKYKTKIYNLDAIIAVGYRINSKKATEFRIWATKILKEYMTKGFALNDERFIKGNKYDIKYFDELLERIKTIRVSERMSYQKITDLFIATSTDYNPKSEEAYTFFKIVQNKLHYAISGHTAAELIYERANSEHEHMGLTNWKNSPDGLIYKYDVTIAKNYLNEEELNKLNDLTNMFLVFAEDEAKERHIMTMQDWIVATDDLLKFRRKNILKHSGNISHKEAVEKAESEYEKFRVIQDQKYISSMDEFYDKYLNESKLDDNNG